MFLSQQGHDPSAQCIACLGCEYSGTIGAVPPLIYQQTVLPLYWYTGILVYWFTGITSQRLASINLLQRSNLSSQT